MTTDTIYEKIIELLKEDKNNWKVMTSDSGGEINIMYKDKFIITNIPHLIDFYDEDFEEWGVNHFNAEVIAGVLLG